MEEVKFWTKEKLIGIAVFIGIFLIIFLAVTIHRNSVKKKYIELENQFTYAAPNYLLKEQINLKKGQWRKIDIKDILKQKLVINDLASNCSGYVIANASKNVNEIEYTTYLDCKKYYKTSNNRKTLLSKNQNKEKTQSQKDTKKPTIKLLGKSTMTIKLNSKYKEKGAVATDNVDGDITDKIKITGKVDTSVVGEYEIVYTVSDKAGNKATKKRKIIVKEQAAKEIKDKTNPVISFNSQTVQTICTGAKIDTSATGVYGYSAYDDVDGDITGNVKITGSTGVINSVGTYKLEYSVTDKAGNIYKTSREYNVKDCTEQNITVTTPTPAPSTNNTSSSSSSSYSSSSSGGSSSGTTNVQPGTVTPSISVPVKGIIVSPKSGSISVGGSLHITATPTNSNASNKTFSFSSSNSGVASVDSSGNVRGISRGTAIITVKSVSTPSQSKTVTINVN